MIKKGKGGRKAEEIPASRPDAERVLLHRWPESGVKILQGAQSALRAAALLRSCDALASATALLKEACAEASLPMVPSPIGIPMLDQVLEQWIRPTFEAAARAHQELARSSGPAGKQARLALGLTALGGLLGIDEVVWQTPYRAMAFGAFSAHAWATSGKVELEPLDYALLEVAIGLESPVQGHQSYDIWRLRRGNWSKRKKQLFSDLAAGAVAFFDLTLDALETAPIREHFLRSHPSLDERAFQSILVGLAQFREKAALDFSKDAKLSKRPPRRSNRIPMQRLEVACEIMDKYFAPPRGSERPSFRAFLEVEENVNSV
jgi:hypothetical protein